MREITLYNSDKVAIIDDCDFENVSKYKWGLGHNGYAFKKGWDKERKETLTICLHKFIMNPSKGLVVDHINRNPLDNTRKNLRCVSQSQNILNSKLSKSNTSGYKGVYWNKINGNWNVKIKLKRKSIHLGCANKLEEAISLRKNAEVQYGVAL